MSRLYLLLLALAAGASATVKSCSITTLSCSNTTAIADTCCFNYPGGQILQTQFWDTSPATGPDDSWTIHGLWPDNCDGTYESNCDSSRAYTDTKATLTSAGETDLLDYINTYWKASDGDDAGLWEHEWAKHGTCISTFEKSCYTSYTTEEEYIDFLHATVDLFKTRDTYSILAAAGITPKSSGTYSATAIRAALEAAHGAGVTIRCSSGAIDEVWYSYYVRGSIQTGEFVAAEPVGQSDSCSGNVSYLPKSDTATTATTTKTTTTAATATATGTFSGTGYLSVTTSGAATGCLISAGTWYVSGTCATYTATASGTGFTLKSSKGYCAVGTDGAFGCSSSTTAQVFTAVDGALAPGVWYAASVPSGTTQVKVYDSSTGGTTELVVGWTVV